MCRIGVLGWRELVGTEPAGGEQKKEYGVRQLLSLFSLARCAQVLATSAICRRLEAGLTRVAQAQRRLHILVASR